MFVGDGVNDSPVLAQAEVGVAINSVADITVQAAGIVVMKDRLDDVLNAILISKATFKRIKYNFAWAFIYNIVLIPIAMGVFYPIKHEKNGMTLGFQLDPIYAGIAMAMSSFSVVLSSLWLKTFRY
jgi:Cu+-exporting ATPase